MEPQGLAERTLGIETQTGVQEIIDMLMNGISPEDLINQGVPVELVEQAIAMISQRQSVGQQRVTPDEAMSTGLAERLA